METRFPGEEMEPGCTVGRWRVRRGGVNLWAVICWETLGAGIYVDVALSHTTYPNAANQIHPFIALVFPAGRSLLQQDNAPCRTTEVLQEWLEKYDREFKVSPWPANSPDLCLIGICGMCRIKQV